MNPAKILVVDDTPDNIQLLSDVLFNAGLSVSIAKNGRQALKMAFVKPPDLILLDIAMPDMDGYEVCEELKKNQETKHIPVIFLTALAETKDILKGFEIGAVDYITKPFHIAEVVARVNTHLDLKKAKDIIANQNEKLIQLDATKDKFFSIIANDLRIPIDGISQIVKKYITNDPSNSLSDAKKMMIKIDDYSFKAFQLLDKLQEWSRLVTGTIPYNPRKHDVDLVIKNVIEQMRSGVNEKGLNLIYENPVTRIAYADSDLVRSILTTIISNAIKYTNFGGDIIISTKDTNDNYVEITVYDTGIGVTDEEKQLIFKKNNYYSKPGTNNENGLGIGLKIALEYVLKHNGKIWVESMTGIGSDFKFTLPKTN